MRISQIKIAEISQEGNLISEIGSDYSKDLDKKDLTDAEAMILF